MSDAKNGTSSAPPAADRSSAHIGIVCSHKGELTTFLKRVDRQKSYEERSIRIRGGFLGESNRIVIAEAGSGFARHRAAAEWLMKKHQPAWILSVGFSSSLSQSVAPGDIVLASEIRDLHGNELPVRCTLKPRSRIHVGRTVCPDSHPATGVEKLSLAESTEAIAADTGSMAVVQVCQEQDVRCLTIRGIIDSCSEDVPEAAAGMVFRSDSRSKGAALGKLFAGFTAGAAELKAWRNRASNTELHLDRFLAGVTEQISELLERNRQRSSRS